MPAYSFPSQTSSISRSIFVGLSVLRFALNDSVPSAKIPELHSYRLGKGQRQLVFLPPVIHELRDLLASPGFLAEDRSGLHSKQRSYYAPC